MLDELAKVYHNETACNEALKKLKDADNFVNKSVSIGNALCFRELLHEALQQVVQEKLPFIFETTTVGFNQYRRNTFMATELLPTDLLAMDCGINMGTADQALKKFLSKAIGSADAPLWDLLPYMYAASFTSQVWRDAQYRPAIEGYTNNAHTLAKCINDLIVAFKSITMSNQLDEKEITNLLKEFVEVSSVILLRMARSINLAKQEKHTPVDFPSVIIFMDLFISASPLLTQEVLESCLPYSLLRNEWKSIYSSGKAKESKKESSDVF